VSTAGRHEVVDPASMTFTPPRRRLAARVADWLGRHLPGAEGRPRLDPGRIVAAAQSKKGLQEWGSGQASEALEVLTRSFDGEAQLTPWGRIVMRGMLTGIVVRRLQIHEQLTHRTEIGEQRIRRPLFVVGPPRSGTTLLYELLAKDPRARPLLFWESLRPAPEGRTLWTGKDRRLVVARRIVGLMKRTAPGLADVHPVTFDGPEECTWLMANTLCSAGFSLFGRIPGYDAWLAERSDADWARAYRFYEAQLRLLQWQVAGGHWVLKSPVHLPALGALLEVFPDACVVRTHRDPVDVVPSTCSLFAILRSLVSDAIEPDQLGQEAVRRLGESIEKANQAAVAHASHVMDVDFESLVEDKIGTVRRIYARFGYELGDDFERDLAKHEAAAPFASGHRYSLAQFGLSAAEVRRRVPY
jgi:hypothetical protein